MGDELGEIPLLPFGGVPLVEEQVERCGGDGSVWRCLLMMHDGLGSSVADEVVASIPCADILDPCLELLDLVDGLVQRQRRCGNARRDDGMEKAAPLVGLLVQVDDELDAVFHVEGQLADLTHPGHHHQVPDAFVVGHGEEGLHHLELARDEHQITLRTLPKLCFLLDCRLGLGHCPLHHRLGQANGELRHGSILLSPSSQIIDSGVLRFVHRFSSSNHGI
ncbi:hypothetical protein PR202_ga24493 [Eleusine coracana subsp. coracana]|uniref:Uncharacterized protein n=1 Tax=Eleusine coracana subsp. coracana TaxID=191504 RepID=A0AAV5D833_ELECO|nr:hypothetical protein PR202_ga24493 [Eleusine coracana subsp. coracana]